MSRGISWPFCISNGASEGVKQNIAVFGGDPKSSRFRSSVVSSWAKRLTDANPVTAIGHSVGALDIGLHLLSAGDKPTLPFHKAMYDDVKFRSSPHS